MATGIEWTDKTWNPVRGCSRVSEGCRNCYAERIAARFCKPGEAFDGFAQVTAPRDSLDRVGGRRNGWTGKVEGIEGKLLEPLSWRKPARVFVNSMSDLFHEDVPDAFIDRVFAVMALAPQHTFQILTKRPERMRAYLSIDEETLLERWAGASMEQELPLDEMARDHVREGGDREEASTNSAERLWSDVRNSYFPLPNVWLGVSVENQHFADERIPLLLQTPAAVRFISAEPLLGPIDISRYMWPVHPHWPAKYRSPEEAIADGAEVLYKRQGLVGAWVPFLNWVIVGGESGPGARPFDLAWARSIVAQCQAAGVPCFVKQLGAKPIETDSFHDGTEPCCVFDIKDRKGGDPSEWPEDLRVRQFPEVRA